MLGHRPGPAKTSPGGGHPRACGALRAAIAREQEGRRERHREKERRRGERGLRERERADGRGRVRQKGREGGTGGGCEGGAATVDELDPPAPVDSPPYLSGLCLLAPDMRFHRGLRL